MLTAELVRVRRQGGELRVVPLDGKARERALPLAAALLSAAEAHVGKTRDQLEEAWDAVTAEPRDRRLLDGLRKLVEDRCEFDAGEGIDAEGLRRELFARAAAARRATPERLDAGARQALLAEVGRPLGLEAAAVEAALYADLRGAHRLRALRPITAGLLLDGFDLAQAQAVLLRAVRVSCQVECAAAGGYRALFHKLKFLRLLHTIERRPGGGYQLTIDGPYSLFESATRYGLQLALALPALCACDRLELVAEVRWGKERTPLRFHLEARAATAAGEAELPDEVAALARAVDELGGPWQARPTSRILELPGVGLCVPDLEFRRPGRSTRVYLEVLGFWSRQAVWRRVELVERGLPERILFAVSHHLRVSEEALDEDLPGALYVYKRVLSARAVIDKVERLASR